jgi:Rrf2 family nitric oxide-sensitive transcriptional repressor
MQLSLFSDYSMRVLLFLAVRPGQGATIRQIATAYGISRTHLMKVANELTRQGCLQSTRGRSGGLKLAIPAEKINVGKVLRQSERHIPLVQCFDAAKNTCVLSPACRFKSVLEEAEKKFYDSLSAYTVADLVRSPAVRSVIKQAAETLQ